jgi:hypothetical protein
MHMRKLRTNDHEIVRMNENVGENHLFLEGGLENACKFNYQEI